MAAASTTSGRQERIVIIGGGPAGYEAALVAAQLGAQVTVIERDGVGGASVLTDCVPSKTLIAAAGAMTSVRDSAVLGLQGAVSPRSRSTSGRSTTGSRAWRWRSRPTSTRGWPGRACRIIAGQGRLSDEIRGLAAHRVQVVDAEGADRRARERRRPRRHRRRPARAAARRARRRAHPRLARRLRPEETARAPGRRRLGRHRRRVRQRLPGGRGAGHARLLARPGAAGRGLRRRGA